MLIKRLAFLDIMKEESLTLADNADKIFDVEFTLKTGELANVLKDPLKALGGEVTASL